MNSKIFSLAKSDVIKGLVTSVFSAVIMSLASIAQQPGFDIALVNWNQILQVAIGAFLGYIGKNFFSSSTPYQEKVMGVALPTPKSEK